MKSFARATVHAKTAEVTEVVADVFPAFFLLRDCLGRAGPETEATVDAAFLQPENLRLEGL